MLDRDDTAPTALAFASGGTVVAGAIGAAIGRLAVTRSRHPGGFSFSFGDDDAWRFEVVDGVLKLRDGISLGLDDMPQRPLIVEVSDGHQSAAFLLWLGVADPDTRLADLPAGATRGGFGLAVRRRCWRCARAATWREVDALDARGAAADPAGWRPRLVLPAAQRVQFADGFQDIGAGSTGVARRGAGAGTALGGGQAAEAGRWPGWSRGRRWGWPGPTWRRG